MEYHIKKTSSQKYIKKNILPLKKYNIIRDQISTF